MACWILSALLYAVAGGSSDCTIVHFTADLCEPCRQIEPALQQLRQEGWTIQTVDVVRQVELVQQFRVKDVPTLAIICRDQEVDRLVGLASYERILERVERAAARNQSGLPRAATPARQAIVRGQSPELSGFPLLASNNTFGDRKPDASESPVGNGAKEAAASTNLAPTNDLASMAAPNIASVSPAVQSQPLNIEQAIARAAAATVRIRVEEANTTAYGTGTIVDVHGREALILTCGHLFRDMQPHTKLTVDLFPGTAQEVTLPSELIDFKAEGEDIGLISFRSPMQIEPVPILGRGQKVAVGQPAFSFGCDRGANPTRRDTQIKNINRYLGADNIEIVGAPVVGRSGGGLFDMQGRLIGVCNAANAEDDEGIYAAADVVFTQIERLALSEVYEGDRPRAPDEGDRPRDRGPRDREGDREGDRPRAGPEPAVQFASGATPAPSHGWQQPGHQPVVPAVTSGLLANGEAQPAGGSLQWPDQSASVLQLAANGPETVGGENPATAMPAIAANTTRQVICIVRDSGGQDKVITIDAPPEQLLQMIHQQSQQQLQRR